MFKIGLTGGIGSGKSVVAGIFEVLGIPVYYADIEARKIMESDEELKDSIVLLFGKQAYENGRLNRAFLAEKIFNAPALRMQLNELVHPKTILHAEDWFAKQQAPFSIKEAALIFESGSEKKLDTVIGVTAPLELKVKRIMKRDGIIREAALARINSQMDEVEKMKRCDYVIDNNELNLLTPQVIAVYEALIKKSQST